MTKEEFKTLIKKWHVFRIEGGSSEGNWIHVWIKNDIYIRIDKGHPNYEYIKHIIRDEIDYANLPDEITRESLLDYIEKFFEIKFKNHKHCTAIYYKINKCRIGDEAEL